LQAASELTMGVFMRGRIDRREFIKAMGLGPAAMAMSRWIGSPGLFASERVTKRPNIVFIMADDMGYGDVTCYNPDSKIPTPHIDRLAQQNRT
jgi:arylsulfatase A